MARHVGFLRFLSSIQGLSAIVFVVALFLYTNTLLNGFVWDDRALIVENPRIQQLDKAALRLFFTTHFWDGIKDVPGLYRPLVTLSYAIDYQVFDGKAWGFHLTNVLLNAVACALAFLLVRALLPSSIFAAITALVFAASPLHTENVAWISGRTDVIAGLWIFASIYLYVLARRRGSLVLWGGAVAAYVMALFAKETAIVVPAILLVIDVAALRREHRQADGLPEDGPKVPWKAVAGAGVYVAVLIVFLFVRTVVLGVGFAAFRPETTGVLHTLALAASVFAGYTLKLLWPFALNAEYETRAPEVFLEPAVLAGIGLMIILALVVYRYRRRSEVVVGAAWLVLFLGPVLNLVPLTEVSAERFLYLPSLGFSMLLAYVFTGVWRPALAPAGAGATMGSSRSGKARKSDRRKKSKASVHGPQGARARPGSAGAMLVLLSVLLVTYGVRTVTRNADWQSEARLFAKTVDAAGDNARAHLNLGNTHLRAGDARRAIDEFNDAIALDATYSEAWSGLSRAYRRLGQYDRAIEYIQKAIGLEPGRASFYNSLGTTYARTGDHEAASRAFAEAMRLDPEDDAARFNLALSQFLLERYGEAYRLFESVRLKDTRYVHAYYYLTVIAFRNADAASGRRYGMLFLERYKKEDAYTSEVRSLLSGG